MSNFSTRKSKTKKDNIVFIDWDGTVCHDRLWSSLLDEKYPHWEKTKNINSLLFGKNKRLVRRWMKGKETSETINKYLSEKIDISYNELWRNFVRDSRNMRMHEEVGPLLMELKKTSYVCLITGNMDSFTRFTAKSQKLNRYFDEIVNSYDTGRLKTDYKGLEFKRISKKVNVPLNKSLLLDDSEKVCNIFNEIGGRAIRVRSKNDTVTSLEHLVKKRKVGEPNNSPLAVKQPQFA